MKFIAILLLTIFAQSCAFLPTASIEQAEYLTRGVQSSSSADEIRTSLQKSDKTGGGFINAQVLPYSEAYLSARRETRVSTRGLSPQAQAKMKTEDFDLYLREKNCFQVEAQVIRHQESMELSQWEAFFVDEQNVSHPLVWQSFGAVIQGRFASSHGELPQWVVSGIACTQDQHQLELGFSIRLTPSFVPWPFPKTMVFQWVFGVTEQERKEKRRSFKRYRGY